MSSMKRFRLAVIFLIAAAFLAGTSAHAGRDSWAALTSTGAEPAASGTYCLQHIRWVVPNYYADLTVRCAGLTPRATHQVLVWMFDWRVGYIGWAGASFTTTKQGTGQVTVADVLFPFDAGPWYVDVFDADGVVVLTSQY
jgi:hypothetical protein